MLPSIQLIINKKSYSWWVGERVFNRPPDIKPKISNLFLRFGDFPQGNISRNHFTNTFEKGLCVYPCVISELGVVPCLPNDNFFLMESPEMFQLFALLDRKCYVLDGRIVGQGTGGEPVISDFEVLGEFDNFLDCGVIL